MDEGLLYLEREGNIYFSQPEGKGKRATVYIGYCFQVYRGEMCTFFFYEEMTPRVICRESSKMERLVRAA